MIISPSDVTLRQAWAEFTWEVGHRPELIIAGVQRIHRDVIWKIPPKVFFDDSMPLAVTGYTTNKIAQLRRNYMNFESLERARRDVMWRIENKKYGSGVMDFRGQEKKGTKQDYCIASAVVGYYPQKKATTIDVFYRTAELIKRFRGDLVFFREFIFEEFSEAFSQAYPMDVTLHFANCTFHPMFVILLVGESPDTWEDHLERMRRENVRLYRNCLYWAFRYVLGEPSWVENYSSAHQVQRIAFRCFGKRHLVEFKKYVRRSCVKQLSFMPDSVAKSRTYWDK